MWFVTEVGLLTACSMQVITERGIRKTQPTECGHRNCFFLTIKVNLIAMTAAIFPFVFLNQIFRKIILLMFNQATSIFFNGKRVLVKMQEHFLTSTSR